MSYTEISWSDANNLARMYNYYYIFTLENPSVLLTSPHTHASLLVFRSLESVVNNEMLSLT